MAFASTLNRESRIGSPYQAETTVLLDLVGLFPVPEIRFLAFTAQVPKFLGLLEADYRFSPNSLPSPF